MRLEVRFCSLMLAAFAAVSSTTLAAAADTEEGTLWAEDRPPVRSVLHGTVLDPSRGPVAAAVVSSRREAGGVIERTRTDALGRFTLPLAAGSLMIEIDAPGFVRLAAAVAGGSGETTQEYVLRLAPLRESVTVNAGTSYRTGAVSSATRTLTALRDVPQSVTVVTRELIRDQSLLSLSEVVAYLPGVTAHQGENNRDQVIIRGNNSSADFFVNGVRDDVQYFRDLYNVERVEALKGPNAMVFGRGGGGGVINRVTKEAVFAPVRELSLLGGSYDAHRVSADIGQPLSRRLAFRLNGVYEGTDSFRRGVDLERHAVNPTFTLAAGERTRATLGYERVHDARVADRGITSVAGRPADVDIATFYGDASNSHVRADVDLLSGTIEHQRGRVTVRNRTLFGAYDRFYQNYVPGAVSADRSQVTLTVYNNATQRQNLFSQTDVVVRAQTGPLHHLFLAGAEIGRQRTDNFRQTGFFDDKASSLLVPYADPTTRVPVSFRQNATDADNRIRVSVGAGYVQDQVEVSRSVQLVAGVRLDRFDLRYHNDRNGDALRRVDDLVSPRAGIVLKPVAPVSVYGSYSVSHLPSSGDQFSSLTTVTQQVEPERFRNLEAGVKWEPRSDLSVTTAVYRLDRTNTRATDPNDPARIIQTGSQRTNGFELGINGRLTRRWTIAGGYAWQDAFVTSATVSARAGAHVGQVPHHSLSLWNSYDVARTFSAALGVLYRTDMFAAVDDTVVLPGYTRVDAALFWTVRRGLRLQANLENLLDRRYYAFADGNTNISPGRPRALRVGMTAGF